MAAMADFWASKRLVGLQGLVSHVYLMETPGLFNPTREKHSDYSIDLDLPVMHVADGSAASHVTVNYYRSLSNSSRVTRHHVSTPENASKGPRAIYRGAPLNGDRQDMIPEENEDSSDHRDSSKASKAYNNPSPNHYRSESEESKPDTDTLAQYSDSDNPDRRKYNQRKKSNNHKISSKTHKTYEIPTREVLSSSDEIELIVDTQTPYSDSGNSDRRKYNDRNKSRHYRTSSKERGNRPVSMNKEQMSSFELRKIESDDSDYDNCNIREHSGGYRDSSAKQYMIPSSSYYATSSERKMPARTRRRPGASSKARYFDSNNSDRRKHNESEDTSDEDWASEGNGW
ncbi:hypothetical protein FE257_008535 [Aspergillus nanangensis]|uniref:Uncharacterized protein n=1 Tax=Aspergillus nanangensis TaxID=2582783 RepID=A0AAD4CMQ6_ASPNN|nr:hypothetical protein FE257_008535 [Aspergillus nanangensis]